MPYSRLRFDSKHGVLKWDGGGSGRDSMWEVVADVSNAQKVGFRNVGSSKCWLGADRDGLVARVVSTAKSSSRSTDQHLVWHAFVDKYPVPLQAAKHQAASVLAAPAYVERVSALSEDELRAFVRDGFLVVRGAAPPGVCANAKAFVNARLGQPNAREIDENNAIKFGGNSANAPDVVAVARAPPVARLIEQLIGADQVARVDGCQIALRFPRCVDSLVAGRAAVQTELTGRSWHTDGQRQGKKHSFTLLVGVALSDTKGINEGNLCVWPGSHRVAHTLMRWPDGAVQREGGSWTEGAFPDIGAPVQLQLRAGDVFLAHHEICHCGGPHIGGDLRYMLYYRVRHRDWAKMVRERQMLCDMWCDIAGVHGVLQEMGKESETPKVDTVDFSRPHAVK
eukprot:g2917.t1